MKLSTALLTLSITAAHGPTPIQAAHVFRATQEDNSPGLTIISGGGVEQVELPSGPTINVRDYTSDACQKWLDGVFAADTDGSNGLSAEEYHKFLQDIDDPPYVSQFFNISNSYLELPWLFKVTHKALACRCQTLGLGDGCCTGEDAEIPFFGLRDEDLQSMTQAQQKVASEYKADMCNSVAAVFEEVVPQPAPTGSPTLSLAPTTKPTESPVAPVPDATPSPTDAPVVSTPPPAPDAPIIPNGLVFECVSNCVSEPKAGDTAGWISMGPCYAGTDNPCVAGAFDEDKVYVWGDQVTVKPVVTVVTPPPAPTDAPVAPVTPSPTDSPVALVTPPPTDSPVVSIKATPPPAPDAPTKGLDIVGSVLDYSSFDYAALFERKLDEIPEYFNATEIENNKGANNVLSHVIKAFGQLANQLIGNLQSNGVTEEGKRKRNLRGGRGLQPIVAQLNPVQVTDIPCPPGLVYAPKDLFCINFKMSFDTDPSNEGIVDSLITNLKTAIDDEGKLYDIIKETYPKTFITGMGSPGKGEDYTVEKLTATTIQSEEADTVDEESSGLGNAAIIFIILIVVILPVATLAMYVRYKKVQDDERLERVAEYNAKQQSRAVPAGDELLPVVAIPEEDEWSASHVESFMSATPGSALAAMGTAGAAATIVRSGKKDDKAAIRAEVTQLVKETNAPKSADELLAAYAGRENELLTHLRNMKAKQDKTVEIQSLVAETNAPKSADELLAAYDGREDELLSNLRKMKTKQDNSAEIRSLIADTNAPKSADELLAAYDGREKELLMHLRKMKAKQDKKAEITAIVARVSVAKSAEELLAAYDGREDELMKNLQKMEAKQMKDSQVDVTKAEITSLVASSALPKSSEELLAAYEGREDELLKNLTKMKSNQELQASTKATKQAIIRSLVDETNPGKSAEELMNMYEGKEDELIKNLTKMKSKNLGTSAKASKQASIRSLVDETNPGRSAEELMTMYDGKEDELIKNLTKMKSKNLETSAKTSKQESIKSLVDETNPGKSAEELLTMYDGKEDELIKNLTKMKSKQNLQSSAKASKQASIRSLVDETNPGKSAEELISAYDGKEDELIKNLSKMKAKKEKKEKRASITSLVNETNPGKSAEELIVAYDGKEDELIKNLTKMKSKQDLMASKIPKTVTMAPSAVLDDDSKKASLHKEVTSLVASTNPGKSAEELLAAFEGREEELVAHLTKLKKSSRNLV
eukprot:CAMPEP_0201994884 /NCGR_PEP_ID=MMETSP0905-20130828/2567_1 /ASSEMBLY_ACC=CAM_ASM_000554 /TAXON_ID=420261 /ORGANISM="Thalassiosira antarctica, Strain CCMP982" /LENGTH=1215 /DNA_ID=CAMNT_0048549931 /DNA_START=312 /DNA_END=3959 /DNA_ORIENTATION=-